MRDVSEPPKYRWLTQATDGIVLLSFGAICVGMLMTVGDVLTRLASRITGALTGGRPRLGSLWSGGSHTADDDDWRTDGHCGGLLCRARISVLILSMRCLAQHCAVWWCVCRPCWAGFFWDCVCTPPGMKCAANLILQRLRQRWDWPIRGIGCRLSVGWRCRFWAA